MTEAEFDSALRTEARNLVRALPEWKLRVGRALELALNGAVQTVSKGLYAVHSASDAEVVYQVTKTGCDCPDASRAPEGQCKHRIAVWLYEGAMLHTHTEEESA